MSFRDNYNIAIVGLGNVGSEVYRHLVKNKRLIEKNTNSTYQIKYISAKNFNKKRGFSIPKKLWVKNPLSLVKKDDVDIIIELIGSPDGVAKKLAFAALKNNKHFITANKALIFKHGNELAKIAEKNSVNLLFEASVGGGIPIIKSIKESLVGNKLFHIYGVLNGTTNFILTEIERTKKSFKEILLNAQKLGYAEANPKLDLNGDDVKSKISILSALCFKTKIINKSFLTEGIEQIDLEDVEYAHKFKYMIKLLGISEIIDNKIKQRVHPCLISKDSDLAKINGANNAIMVEGNPVGKIVYQGLGAGKGPTTSSVVSDLNSILKGDKTLPFGFSYSDAKEYKMFDFDNHICKFYLRIVVKDKPGVLSKITSILSTYKISIQSILQQPLSNPKFAHLVIITHNAKEKDMKLALKKISKDSDLAKINGANNAIMVEGNPVGKIVYQGLGAGKGPTTSSVVSDLNSILKGDKTLPFGFSYSDAKEFKMFDFNNHICKFYLRIVVKDKPGVLSKITSILSSYKISIQSILQQPLSNPKYANLVIITHNAKEMNMKLALKKISKEKFISKKITMIRIRNEKKLWSSAMVL